jgi:6-phosphogluconolactonase
MKSVTTPQKLSQTVQRPNSEEVALAARTWFVERARNAIAERGQCLVSLSGGSTPKRLYELLAELDDGVIDWPKVHLFWGDERNVPLDHIDSNYRMVRQALLDRLKDSKPVVHRIPTGDQPVDRAAREYELRMREFARGAPFRFDVVLLGLGDDAHTASLFPESMALNITDRWVVANQVEKLATTRITLTAPIFNAARNVAFLVCGSSKQWAIDRIRGSIYNPTAYPAQLIQPDGELWWFVDEAIKV